MKTIDLQIVVNNKEEAIIAEKAGADKLEISISPERGGLTVDIDDLTSIVVTIDIPAFAMVRPISNSYEYNENEFQQILHTIEICKLAGIQGVTVGFLKNGKIDRERLQKIIDIKGDLELIFNRAIDSVIDYEREIEYLANLDEVDFIQTSGAAEAAFDGRTRFKPLMMKYPNKFILCAALTIDQIKELITFGIDKVIFQVGEGVRKNGIYSQISYDKIVELTNIIKEIK